MSYTPTTWTTGDTITATAMNKIENGIADAGSGGGVDVQVWQADSSGTLHAEGDFASALAKASTGKPLVAFVYSGTAPNFYYPAALGTVYESANPNQIKLMENSVTYYLWTANSITYVD